MPLQTPDGKELKPSVMWKMLLGPDSRAAFFVCYVPTMTGSESAAVAIINNFDWLIKIKSTISIREGFQGEELNSLDECIFTGRLIIYVEGELAADVKAALVERGRRRNLSVLIRDWEYMNRKKQRLQPMAFVSHDSRDKDLIARPLAVSLTQNLCSVWYDEFSLNVGDSLREKIEKGLKECKRCILVLTPNFLSNKGWTKKEFDSIFTRELLEKENLVLPIWSGVKAKEVFEYSPALADRVGVDWSLGLEVVTKRLLKASCNVDYTKTLSAVP